MKSLRLVTLLLLPLLAPAFMAEQPSSVSYAQARGPARFPAAVAPRNDIQMQNRVPVRMRDGVTLYADVYRPAERGSLPGHRLENARTAPNVRPPRTTRRSTSPSAAMSTSSRTFGADTSPMASGIRSDMTSGTAMTPSNGPPSSRGRTGRWACRADPISGRTSGGPRRPRPRVSSPSFRWWPRRASITTGSR